ncbi:MAG: polyprenyl diphosphate synthase [Actinomycetota bacterium]|nr:polyprenyl diphosphate synthase [Actinomycetota bacterium]
MSDGARATRVAIIMDGNGRWAGDRGLPVLEGHRRGAQTLKQTVKDAVAMEIRELTVYAFSTENWSRPEDEVSGLMEMFAELIVSETPELDEQGVRMRFVGRRDQVSERLREQMGWAETETADNERMTLFVAFNYGGRAEILDAAEHYEGGGEEVFAGLLYAPEMSEPELVIRTSGEKRLSNFLLWQSAYAELYFSEVLWPDFDRAELKAALQEYATRARRFGTREATE